MSTNVKQYTLSYSGRWSSNQTPISVPCQGGTFKDGSLSVCQQCPTNSYSAERAGLCITCPRGSHASEDHIRCGTFLWYLILSRHLIYFTGDLLSQIKIGTTKFDLRLFILDCFFKIYKYQNRSVSCESLPSNWKEIITETQFPLPPGAEVSLKCSPGHTLTGDSTVTCVEGTDFSSANTPSCVLGSKIKYFVSNLSIIKVNLASLNYLSRWVT